MNIPVVPDQITLSICIELTTMSSPRSRSEDLEDRHTDRYFDAEEDEENEDDDPDYEGDGADGDEDERDEEDSEPFDETDEFHGTLCIFCMNALAFANMRDSRC